MEKRGPRASDPERSPPCTSLLPVENIRTLKIDHLDLGYIPHHPLFGNAAAAQVLTSLSHFFGDKPITTLMLNDIGFSEKRLLTELLKRFQHIRTFGFTAVHRNTMFNLPPTGLPLVPDDSVYTPIPLRNLVIGLSEVSDTELRGLLQKPYPLSLSELELLEFRDRTIHDRSYFEDIEQALEMTRRSLKTAIFNFYWIDAQSSRFLSFQHLTDVRIKIDYCVPSDSVMRDKISVLQHGQHLPRNQWRFWLRSLSQAETYCMRRFTVTIVLYFRARVPKRSIFNRSQSPRSLGLGLGFGPPSLPLLWVNGPNMNDLTALREALMRPQLQDLQSITVLLDFNLAGSRFHPGLLTPRLQEFHEAFQPLIDARHYTFNLSVIGDQSPPPEERLSRPYKLLQREDLSDSEADEDEEEEEENQETIQRLQEIIEPTSTFSIRNVMIQHWIDLDPERNRYKAEFEKWISQVPAATQKKYFREEKEKRKIQKAAASNKKRTLAKK